MQRPTELQDPRRAKSLARVLAAAVELLREGGSPGLTIEAVAARSGVAKTTIYRQFENRDQLHHAALRSVACSVPMPHSDDLVADITSFCVGLNQALRNGDLGGVLPTGFDGAERSDSLAKMMQGTGEERRAAITGRLHAALRSGELSDDSDIDLLNSQLVGPLFYRRFISRQPTSAAFIARHVGSVLRRQRS